jgi:hypothetical protein
VKIVKSEKSEKLNKKKCKKHKPKKKKNFTSTMEINFDEIKWTLTADTGFMNGQYVSVVEGYTTELKHLNAENIEEEPKIRALLRLAPGFKVPTSAALVVKAINKEAEEEAGTFWETITFYAPPEKLQVLASLHAALRRAIIEQKDRRVFEFIAPQERIQNFFGHLDIRPYVASTFQLAEYKNGYGPREYRTQVYQTPEFYKITIISDALDEFAPSSPPPYSPWGPETSVSAQPDGDDSSNATDNESSDETQDNVSDAEMEDDEEDINADEDSDAEENDNVSDAEMEDVGEDSDAEMSWEEEDSDAEENDNVSDAEMEDVGEDGDAGMFWEEEDSDDYDDYADSGCETHSSAPSEDEIIEILDD